MTTYDHILELRAELRNAVDTAERLQIAAELEAAIEQQAREDAAMDALLSVVKPPH